VKKWVAYGASVRAAQYLVLGGKARALMRGRYARRFEDIRALAHPVLRHRILTNFHAESEGVTTDQHHRSAARGRAGAEVGHVTWVTIAAAAGSRRPVRRSEGARADRQPGALARTVVDGFINGLHRSPYSRASLDFAEHRGYVPGDDIRRIDWRLYARTDRYYIKEYEADTNANFAVLLDVSKSMGFGSAGITKLDYAKFLAGCLTYLVSPAARPGRPRGVRLDIVEYVPPSAKHMDIVLHTLDRLTPQRPGSLARRCTRSPSTSAAAACSCSSRTSTRSPDVVLDAIGPLRFRGNDMIVFHLLDPAEIDFSFTTPAGFEDLESGEQIPIVPDALAAQYQALVREHIAALTERFSANRIDYTLVNTSSPLDHALFSYLTARERMTRVR
jgi:uncharacterized protein (DUF58 family)